MFNHSDIILTKKEIMYLGKWFLFFYFTWLYQAWWLIPFISALGDGECGEGVETVRSD